MITISNEIVSLLNIGVSKIIINGEFDQEWRTSNEGTTETVPSTTNTIEFHLRLKIRLGLSINLLSS
jgi:hypothetical protein